MKEKKERRRDEERTKKGRRKDERGRSMKLTGKKSSRTVRTSAHRKKTQKMSDMS